MIINIPKRDVNENKYSDIKEQNDTINTESQYQDLLELASKFKLLCDNINKYKRTESQKSENKINFMNSNDNDLNQNRKLMKMHINSHPIRCIISTRPGLDTDTNMDMDTDMNTDRNTDTDKDKDTNTNNLISDYNKLKQAKLQANKLKSINYLNNMGKSMIRKSFSFIYIDIYIDYNSYLSLLLVWFDTLVDNGILIGSMFSSHNSYHDNGYKDDGYNDHQINRNKDSSRNGKKIVHVLPAVETFANIQSQSVFATYDESSSLYCTELNSHYMYSECSAGWYFYK
jgi:hypothetical protein